MKNLTFSKKSMSVTALALLAVFGLAGCGGGGGGGSDSTPAAPFPSTTEAFEQSLNEANVIAQDASYMVDASVEAAYQGQSFIDPSVLANNISQIPGVESAEPTPSGAAIIVKKTDGLFFNVLVPEMSDVRLFEEQSNSAKSKSLSQSSRAMLTTLQRKAISKASLSGNHALILSPFSNGDSYHKIDNVDNVEGILRSAGFEVTTFKDSAAGLAQFKGDYLQQFDVIYIETHGAADTETVGGVKTTVLMTGERYGDGIPSSDTRKNLSESQRKSLAGGVVGGKQYIGISIPWLRETGASNFRNGFLITNACESSKYDDGEKSLSAAFFSLGGGAHVGFDAKVNITLSLGMTEKTLTEMSNGVDLVTASNRTREDPYLSLFNLQVLFGDLIFGHSQLFDDSQRIEEQPYVIVDVFNTDTTAPTTPTSLAATAGNGQITISWDAVSSATYNIYWSTVSGVTKTNGTKISNATSPYAHTGRTNGTTYYYVVTAVNSYGESMESSQVSATTNGTGGVSYTW